MERCRARFPLVLSEHLDVIGELEARRAAHPSKLVQPDTRQSLKAVAFRVNTPVGGWMRSKVCDHVQNGIRVLSQLTRVTVSHGRHVSLEFIPGRGFPTVGLVSDKEHGEHERLELGTAKYHGIRCRDWQPMPIPKGEYSCGPVMA